ncbi:MAG: DUF1592 domain-containing protein [Acidobacteriota bacterium]
MFLRANPGAAPAHFDARVDSALTPAPMSYDAQNAALSEYCGGCHNDIDMKGELSLDHFDAAHAADKAATAEQLVRKMRAGMMPPKTSPQPDAATRLALVTAVEASLDKAATVPNPGHRSFQRLNRAEYASAIRSMFGIDIDVAAYLPADTISAGFDNIADVQMPSATTMQGYLRAAAYVSRAVIGDPGADTSSTTYDVPRTMSQRDRIEGAPFGTRGGTVVTHNFLADGKYKFQLLLHGEPQGELYARTARNMVMEVAIDGARVALVKVDRWISESSPNGLMVQTEPVAVTAGPHKVAATFLREFEGEEDDFMKPIDHTLADTNIGIGYGVTTVGHLRNLAIVGPTQVRGVSDNPTRQRVLVCRPATKAEEPACAKRIIDRLITEAYRRPATAQDLTELMPLFAQGAAKNFDAGVREAMQGVLSSLHFIFRVEETPSTVKPGGIYKINNLDLASRLSFFLWGTIPDRALIDAAANGTLAQPLVFEKQVRRMLADPRSEALSTRFAAQWLRLQDLKKIEPDALDYPYYDEILAKSMERETELLFDHLVRADRPMLELLTADYTFLNERLARHYGILGVTGPTFRQVSYPDDRRRGVLGHGSVLTLTSHGNRTSPVLRGKWVMEVLLGSPPPAPPPNVPDLEKTGSAKDGRLLSVAEQMAVHRANPACNSCHVVIDPIGLALDHFDVTGAWRIKDRGVPVNSAGELYDGTKMNGAAELRGALMKRSEVLVTHFTEVLMAYAVGRRVEFYDMPTIRSIVHRSAAREYRMSDLILGIVSSPAFRTARAEAIDAPSKH